MYTITYGNKSLWNYLDDEASVISATLEQYCYECDRLTVTIPPTNNVVPYLVSHQKYEETVLMADGHERFRGRIMSISDDMDGSVTIVCEEQRGYLNDVLMPKYEEGGSDVPATPFGLFEWYVSSYNERCEDGYKFVVGINEGNSLPRETIAAKPTNRKSVWEEIRSNLVNEIGGWVRARYENGKRYLDYLAAGSGVCRQPVYLGGNLLDYRKTSDSSAHFTAIVPYGGQDEIGIDSLSDGLFPIYGESGFLKQGDRLIDVAAAKRCGIIEMSYKCYSDNPSEIFDEAVRVLVASKSNDTYEIDAFDMSYIDDGTEEIKPGLLVPVYCGSGNAVLLLCTSKTSDLMNPCGDKFTFEKAEGLYEASDAPERLSDLISSGKQGPAGPRGEPGSDAQATDVRVNGTSVTFDGVADITIRDIDISFIDNL